MERTGPPHPPTHETAPDPDRPDRVFLSNYVREIEIGAYREEFGVRQKVRFDVALEIARGTVDADDRIGRVISYDTLIQAIGGIADGPRLNLLETFAERLADAILADPRALRALIRIEKIERLPGGAGLGIEIARRRVPKTASP